MHKLLLSFAIVSLILGTYSAKELSTSAVREGYKAWEPLLDLVTQSATQQLSRMHHVHLDKVDVENTRVANAVMYNLGVEFDIGSSRQKYELAFLQPTEWLPLWGSSSSHDSYTPSSSTAISTPQHQHRHPELSMTLRGPMEVYLGDPSTELHIRAPREVDVGFVNKIFLEEGVNMTVSGFAELYLKEPLSVTSVAIEGGMLKVSVKNTPKVALVGGHVNIVNASIYEALKVKRHGKSEIALLSASGEPVKTSTPFEIPLHDPRVQTIQAALQQLQTGEYATQTIALRRLMTSKLEAVTSFALPVVASGEDGAPEDWDVVVIQGNSYKSGRVVSMHKKPSRTEVTFSPVLAANGTLHSALESFIATRPEYTLHPQNL